MQDGLQKNDHIPLLAAEKHYFKLNEEGHLQYFLYNQAIKRWEMPFNNLFQQKLHGFDVALEQGGAVHLLGYEAEGGLFYLSPLSSGGKSPLLLYKDVHKKIVHLSACLDKKNNLHLLFAAYNKQYAMWWLFYLCYKQQTWTTPRVIDFGYGRQKQYGLLGRDLQDKIYIFYRLFTAGKCCLAFRIIEEGFSRPGEIYFLQEGQTECFPPSLLVDLDNTLHFSWISLADKSLFLNYAGRDPDGKWKNFFNLEISQTSFPTPLLLRNKDKLFLAWEKDRTLLHLYSLHGGDSWRWGKKQILNEKLQPLRLQAMDSPDENCTLWGNILFTDAGGTPPKVPQQPQNFWPAFPQASKEKNGPEEELHVLDVLSSYTLNRAGNLQSANIQLKQKIEQQEKGFLKLYTENLFQTERLREKLAVKNMELKDIEKLLQQTITSLQEHMQQQSKEIATLQAQNKTLQKENEAVKKNNLVQATDLTRLKKKVLHLTLENEALRAEKQGRFSFLPKLFRKRR